MKKPQINRDQSNKRASDFLEKYNAQLSAIPTYAPLKAMFMDVMEKINNAKQQQCVETTQVSAAKNIYRDKLIETMFRLSNDAASQAFGAGKADLAEILDKPLIYFSKATEEELQGRAKEIRKIFAKNSGVLTEITPADLIKIDQEIKDYKNSLSVPKTVIKDRKAEGTSILPGLLNDMDKIKKFIGKLIQSKLPDLFTIWNKAIKVGKPVGRRRTSAVLFYSDAATGVPLRKVKVTIANGENTVVRFSTKKGYVRFYSLKSDNYRITSEGATFITDVRNNVGISKTKIVRLEIKMVKITVSGTLNVFVFDNKSGQGLPGVHVDIPLLNLYSMTDSKGMFTKNNIHPGTYVGTISVDAIKRGFTFTMDGTNMLSLEFGLDMGE
jgi:hypothetical protein